MNQKKRLFLSFCFIFELILDAPENERNTRLIGLTLRKLLKRHQNVVDAVPTDESFGQSKRQTERTHSIQRTLAQLLSACCSLSVMQQSRACWRHNTNVVRIRKCIAQANATAMLLLKNSPPQAHEVDETYESKHSFSLKIWSNDKFDGNGTIAFFARCCFAFIFFSRLARLLLIFALLLLCSFIS